MDNNEEEVSLSDSTIINEPESQSNTELNQENSLTESKIMDDVEGHSAPISVKKSDDYKMFKMIQAMLDVKFNEVKSRFNVNDTK